MKKAYKVGTVALIGRPNVGKSTFLNTVIGQKVSIVTPKPQTTRGQIVAVYEDERGQIFFLDTPGYYVGSSGATRYNTLIAKSAKEADVVVYIVDHTRNWGDEDERLLTIIRQAAKPTIVAINKIDQPEPSYLQNYLDLLQNEAQQVVQTSALTGAHTKSIIDAIFTHLPTKKRDTTVDNLPSPLLSQSSKEFLAELVREKIFLYTSQEVPYQTHVRINSIEENEETNKLSIKGEIIVNNERYKPMLIGKNGQKIKRISTALMKELTIATNKNVSVRLTVVAEK